MVSCKFVRKLVSAGAVSSKLKSVPKDFRSLIVELFSNSNPPRSDNLSEKENNKDEFTKYCIKMNTNMEMIS